MIYKFLPDEAIKSIKDRVIHGTGIRFGSPETKDYDGEYFVPDTETGLIDGANRPFLMEHGYGKTFGVAKVADAIYEKSGEGWTYEATFLDTPIGNQAFNEVITKPYKSSAGAAGHTRRASQVKGAWQLDTWLVAEQSATLTPADSENPRLTRTKTDYIMFALQGMVNDSEERLTTLFKSFIEGEVKDVLTALKDGADARQKLADALLQFKEGFSSEHKNSVSPDEMVNLVAELEQVNRPIPIIGL